ncbi:hypothetical protein B9Z65_8974 [Elsinoe australis]|uniref:RRM domain-containing protein n=1 Tax=Elsinoe australis TaxID=40998 RepID=A0A2P8ABC9_9PEZI|nr:hypothetical protein B9Z65_8974 [Elsinoe australis]
MDRMSKRSTRGGRSGPSATFCLAILNLPQNRDWRIVKDTCVKVVKISGQVYIKDIMHPQGYPCKTAWTVFSSSQDAMQMLQHFIVNPIDGVRMDLCLWQITPGSGTVLLRTTTDWNQTQISAMLNGFVQDQSRSGSPKSINSASPPTSPTWPGYPVMSLQQPSSPTLSYHDLMSASAYAGFGSHGVYNPGQMTALPVMAVHPAMQSHGRGGSSQRHYGQHYALQPGQYTIEMNKVIIRSMDDRVPRLDFEAILHNAGELQSWNYKSKNRRSAMAVYKNHDDAMKAIGRLHGATLGRRKLEAKLAKEGSPLRMDQHQTDLGDAVRDLGRLALQSSSSVIPSSNVPVTNSPAVSARAPYAPQ